jgi:Ser/Thr protein kinase RdoA (MazF antagonist)
VHRVLADAPVPAGVDRWPWDWLDPAEIEEPDLSEAARRAIERAEALAPRLTHGLLHGDPAPEAFVDLDGDVGLIAWGAGALGPLLVVVASAVRDSGERVIAGYEVAGPLARQELDHVPDLLAFRWALQAWYFNDRLRRDDLTGLESRADNEKGLGEARDFLLG